MRQDDLQEGQSGVAVEAEHPDIIPFPGKKRREGGGPRWRCGGERRPPLSGTADGSAAGGKKLLPSALWISSFCLRRKEGITPGFNDASWDHPKGSGMHQLNEVWINIEEKK